MTTRSEDLFSFGTWVRRRRKALDLTQAALADRVGCAGVTIRKLEADAFRPSREIAERLADCLDIPVDDRARFMEAARGVRSVDHLPTPTAQIDLAFRSPTQEYRSVLPIPLATIPHLVPLPAHSHMPLSRNPLFVGREQDLRQLAAALHTGGTAAIGQLEIAAATGLGGIGKTQLACEFVHRYGQYFPGGVFWLSFADPAAVPAEVAACGGADGMQLRPEFGTLPLDEQVKLVLAAWESTTPRLLVFDNCEEEALLDQWRPKHGGCQVLLTSRRRYWDPTLGVQALPLDVLPRPESLALLRTFRPDLPMDDPDLQAIAEMLGDLPLALHLAGSFLAKYRHAITPAQYLKRLHVPTILDDRSLQAAGLSPTQHVQHVARTFEQSYDRLDPDDPTDTLALTLLAHAACFAPGEPIPRWLLLDTLDLREVDAEGALLTEDALMRLIDLGLLEMDAAGSVRLHRLLVAFVQTVLVHGAAQATVEATMLRVTTDVNNTFNPYPLLAIQPHLRFIVEAAQPRTDARTADLCNALGEHLWQLGVYPEAQRYVEQALTIRQRVLGNDHPGTASSLNFLGALFMYQGRYPEAQRYVEQALAIQQRVLGNDHPDTVWSFHSLGGVLMHQGQYAEAQHYLVRALAIRQQVLGNDHPVTTLNLDTLGTLLKYQGQYAEAQGYYEQTLAIRQRVLGNDHPLTANSFNNVGEVLHMQGQYAEAQGYCAQALAIRQRVLGNDHPDTAWSLYRLGGVLMHQGQYAEAQHYLVRALAIFEHRLGSQHPNTARNLKALGEVLHTQGQYAEAQRYLERALAIFEHQLGPQHPDTAQTRRTIAALHVALHRDDARS